MKFTAHMLGEIIVKQGGARAANMEKSCRRGRKTRNYFWYCHYGYATFRIKPVVQGFLSHMIAEINRIIAPRIAPILQGWSTPAYQSFDWGVAAFAVGIALYFAV